MYAYARNKEEADSCVGHSLWFLVPQEHVDGQQERCGGDAAVRSRLNYVGAIEQVGLANRYNLPLADVIPKTRPGVFDLCHHLVWGEPGIGGDRAQGNFQRMDQDTVCRTK